MSNTQSSSPAPSNPHPFAPVEQFGQGERPPSSTNAPSTDRFAALDDEALLRSTKAVAARSNQITAALLDHLAEVHARGAYRYWACPTLQAYCVYELRMSEDAAQRRCRAVRFVRDFPQLLDMVANSSLHLTGLLLVGPHLTVENKDELLRRAAFRRKREIEKLIAQIAPRPDVPSLVEPLGPDGVPRLAPSTYASLVERYERELPPGLGPGDAPALPTEGGVTAIVPDRVDEDEDETARVEPLPVDLDPPEPVNLESGDEHNGPAEPVALDAQDDLDTRSGHESDRAPPDLLSEARDLLWHQLPSGELATVQLLALRALVEKLRRRRYAATARAPKSQADSVASEQTEHSGRAEPSDDVDASTRSSNPLPRELAECSAPERPKRHQESQPTLPGAESSGVGTLGERGPCANGSSTRLSVSALQEECGLRGETAALTRAKHPQLDETTTLARHGLTARHDAAPTMPAQKEPAADETNAPARANHPQTEETIAPARRRFDPPDEATAPATPEQKAHANARAHLPAALKREVWQRDGARCTYVDARGKRCPSTAALEFHHEQAHALGGADSANNLSLRCRAHNRLAAEEDFGAKHMAAFHAAWR